MSGAKKRKYSDEYIKYGFTVTERNGIHLPQCVICHAVLSNYALRPGRLERHLSTNHKELKEKPKEFFTAKLHELSPLCSDLGTGYKALLFHTEVRWLSKGNMLSRHYELKDEMEIFLQKQKQEKLKHEQYDLTKEVLSHLDSLAEEFMHYFPDVKMENSLWTLVQNPFNTGVELLLESLQEEAIDLKCDSSAKRDFETMKLEEFWVKYHPMYQKVGEEALRVILPFSSTYLCEAEFSAHVVLKTKQPNRLDVENDLHCALSSFNPRISNLVRKKQQHTSH
ncbi:SCAN domain-containing protein 3-like [Macrobrachium nipponense]|uniref:SCAN domain-containing protein 3-like n=1 Tax=Macrobrachium nipponense TaxID=159736 RepID=UPI0030C7ECBD